MGKKVFKPTDDPFVEKLSLTASISKNIMRMNSKLAMSSFLAAALTVFVSALTMPAALAAPSSTKRVWTAEEILTERDLKTPNKKRPKYCQGGAFKPCVCPSSVTKAIQYRPAVRECRGKAAIILSRKYLNAYSAVVRDKENKDRWPPQGANGCSVYERDVLGLNKCSVFKVQSVVGLEHDTADAELHCLGASGYSSLFRKVSRITIKLKDIPNSNEDPLERLCLIAPNKPLN